ncbi:uncharacterized protein LOC129587900 isoform X2 [Paramacrobiotus metropolitanus]|uniref:uncharacterized protein LOC129587900 isoform X2 n=1 Tax=Paramacrobiotus metropolitanus TaxID=2943436 RepID=UPI002445BE46|nr:uncharacterized protein LOC129587900 isoform X2 [Paramacrobiotus metropolitanus]
MVTLVLRVAWDACNWWYFVEQLETRPEATAENVWDPFPLRVTLVQFVVLWSVFSSLPFFVSQQVFGVAMVLSWMFGSCIKQLVSEINEAHDDLQRRLGRSNGHSEKHMATAEKLVIALKDRHARLVEYCEEFNDTFAWELFFIYFLDVCAVCGYVADVVMNVESHLLSGKLYHWLSVLLYGVYASVFFIPLVRVHEQGHRIMRALYQMLHTAEHYTPPTEGEHLKKYLVSFINASKNQVLMFHGAEMFHITRHIPIANTQCFLQTWTLTLSAGIVCSEILGHQKKCPEVCQCGAAGNGSLRGLQQETTVSGLDFAL